jgi:hypothetical protein
MIRTAVLVVLAVAASAAGAQSAKRSDPNDPNAKAPPMEYRSAFEGYRPFTDQEAADWRKANEEVGAAGGHAGQRPGQGPGKPTSKPQPGQSDKGHGGHK